MFKKDFVSVIIPVFNKENLIGRCVESLIKQTYNNLEIILIDDGSTDKSWSICQDYEKKDTRIKIFNKPNGGLSDARNYGIKHASGEWISFVDGDDYVEYNYIELLLQNSTDVDLVVCNCYKLTKKQKNICTHVFGNKLFEENDIIYREILIPMITLDNQKTNMLFPVWNKLYRKQIIDNNYLNFDINLPYAEDYMFNVNFLRFASKVRFIDLPLYNYDCTIPGTLSKIPISITKLEHYNYIKYKVSEFFPEKGNEVLPKSIFYDCKHHIRLYARLYGLSGFKSFCNDVYNMQAFKEASANSDLNGSWWHYGLPAFLRRKDHNGLFLCWTYLFSINCLAKHYINRLHIS